MCIIFFSIFFFEWLSKLIHKFNKITSIFKCVCVCVLGCFERSTVTEVRCPPGITADACIHSPRQPSSSALKTSRHSQRNVPTESWPRYWTLRVNAEVNCLFNSISTLLYGHEDKARELRVRTCIQMCNNMDRYLSSPDAGNILKRVATLASTLLSKVPTCT